MREAPSILSPWSPGKMPGPRWRGHLARIAHGRRLEHARSSVDSLPMGLRAGCPDHVARASRSSAECGGTGARSSAADVGTAGEFGALFHREDLGLDIAVDPRLVLEFATLGSDLALDFAVDFDLSGADIADDGGVFADGHAAFVGHDFTIDLPIDDHVIREADGTGDLDSVGEDVCRVGHDGGKLS